MFLCYMPLRLAIYKILVMYLLIISYNQRPVFCHVLYYIIVLIRNTKYDGVNMIYETH